MDWLEKMQSVAEGRMESGLVQIVALVMLSVHLTYVDESSSGVIAHGFVQDGLQSNGAIDYPLFQGVLASLDRAASGDPLQHDPVVSALSSITASRSNKR